MKLTESMLRTIIKEELKKTLTLQEAQPDGQMNKPLLDYLKQKSKGETFVSYQQIMQDLGLTRERIMRDLTFLAHSKEADGSRWMQAHQRVGGQLGVGLRHHGSPDFGKMDWKDRDYRG